MARPAPWVEQTHRELCEELDLPFELMDRIYVVLGLTRPRPDERVPADDFEMISSLPLLFAADPARLRSSLPRV